MGPWESEQPEADVRPPSRPESSRAASSTSPSACRKARPREMPWVATGPTPRPRQPDPPQEPRDNSHPRGTENPEMRPQIPHCAHPRGPSAGAHSLARRRPSDPGDSGPPQDLATPAGRAGQPRTCRQVMHCPPPPLRSVALWAVHLSSAMGWVGAGRGAAEWGGPARRPASDSRSPSACAPGHMFYLYGSGAICTTLSCGRGREPARPCTLRRGLGQWVRCPHTPATTRQAEPGPQRCFHDLL